MEGLIIILMMLLPVGIWLIVVFISNTLRSAKERELKYDRLENQHSVILLKEAQFEEREKNLENKARDMERYWKNIEKKVQDKRENLVSDAIDEIDEYLLDKKQAYKYLAGMIAYYLTLKETEYLKQLGKSTSHENMERKIKIT